MGVSALQSVLSMSSKACAHVQIPVWQAQTQTKALLKHRRVLEDNMVAASLNVLQPVTLNFDKSCLPGGDKREPWHPCLYVTANAHESNAWDTCAANVQRSIGPCPLIRVSEMVGFDADNRPGASARVEQFLAGILDKFFFALAETLVFLFFL